MMSQVDEILENLDITAYTVDSENEEHIVIDKNRKINIPNSLRNIGVQHDHDIETVTFDCPRYWDGIDLHEMNIYINYMRADKEKGMYLAKNKTIDIDNPNIMHFDWTLSNHAMAVKGKLTFLVCIKIVDEYGYDKHHWNSELNSDFKISEGLEVEDAVFEANQDVITDLLVRMDSILVANSPILDESLTQAGLAADAKVTGDKLNTLDNALRSEITERKAEVEVERKRINLLTSLPEGSTSGDAELIDIRLGINGKTYDTAGESVRGQVSLVGNYVDSVVNKNVNNLFNPLLAQDNTGYVTTTGEVIDANGYWITSIFSVVGMTSLYYNYPYYKYICYDSDGTHLPDASGVQESSQLKPITISDNVSYIGLQFSSDILPFEERYKLICTDLEHAYDSNQQHYRINPDVIEGSLKAVPNLLKEDTNNLFNPLKAYDNLAFTTTDGTVIINTDYWSSHYIDVSSCNYILTATPPYKVAWYDESLTMIDMLYDENSSPNFTQTLSCPENAKYARFQYDKSVVPFDSRFDIIICSIDNLFTAVSPRYSFGKDYSGFLDMFKVDTNNLFDPMEARNNICFTTAAGAFYANNIYWITDFIPVDGITSLKTNKTAYKFAWYDIDKKHLGAGDTAPEGAAFVIFQFAKSVLPFEDRFDLIICDGSKEIGQVKPHYYLSGQNKNEVKNLGDHLYKFELVTTPYMSDHTFIKGKLYVVNASNDEHTDTNYVTVYSIDNETHTATHEKTFTHNLGHCNSIDYCPGNDCLIMGNGSGVTSLPGEIYILTHPAERENWNYEDCIKIDISAENWGYKTNVIWGDHNNGQYNIIYVITNDNANIRKLLLTKTNEVFDGGYILIDSWETEKIDVNQGSVYRNGKLYLAIGHSQVWLLEYTLKPGGVIDVQEYKDIFYDETGAILTTPFMEGVTIEDGYIYVGTSDGYIQVYKQ